MNVGFQEGGAEALADSWKLASSPNYLKMLSWTEGETAVFWHCEEQLSLPCGEGNGIK